MAGFTIARLVTAGLLIVALGKLPYGFYTLTRFLCCIGSAYGAYTAFHRQQQRWVWIFGILALLFNPFLPVRLDRSTWAVVDIAAALLMLLSVGNGSLTRKPTDAVGSRNSAPPNPKDAGRE